MPFPVHIHGLRAVMLGDSGVLVDSFFVVSLDGSDCAVSIPVQALLWMEGRRMTALPTLHPLRLARCQGYNAQIAMKTAACERGGNLI